MALFRLSTRFGHWLATVLATVVTADALLTTLQAVLHNIPRARSSGEWLAIAAGVLAPSFASVVLWKARSVRASLLAWRKNDGPRSSAA